MENEMGLWPEEYPASLFQPDPALPPAYFESVGENAGQEPERRLMLAVLKDAVDCFQKNVSAKDVRRRQIFLDAETWIEEESDWPFSFANICEALDMDPQYIRQGLRRWKKAKLAGRRSERKVRSRRRPAARPARQGRNGDRLIEILKAWSRAGLRTAGHRSVLR
jgi:hypothetical protein